MTHKKCAITEQRKKFNLIRHILTRILINNTLMINLLFIYLIILNLHSNNSLGKKFQKYLIAFSMKLFFFDTKFFFFFSFVFISLKKNHKIVYKIKLLTLNCLNTVSTNFLKQLNLLLNRFLLIYHECSLIKKINITDKSIYFF